MARRVVVIGAGFAGLHVVKGLHKEKGVEITLISETNHTLFQPLLYQVATGSLDEDDIATPVRRVLRHQRNVRFVMASADGIDVPGQTVSAGGHLYPYDTLVVAAGVEYNYFGHDEWASLAPSLKSVADAEEIRRRVLTAFERAENENDPDARRGLLTYVLVGGGPTGVEMAGALAELLKESLHRELTRVRPEEVTILIAEGGPGILAQFPKALAEASQRRLESLGVKIRENAHVTEITADSVTITPKDGPPERVPTATVVWTAGVKGVPLLAALGVPLDRGGRVAVDPYLNAPGLANVYVVGDAASIMGPGEKSWPGVAQVAMQSGDYVAKSIRRSLAGREPEGPFKYWDKGNLAVVGRAYAIADLHWAKAKGFPAWLLWLLIHILYLDTFRAKIFVFLRWSSAFLFKDRSAIVFDAPSLPGK